MRIVRVYDGDDGAARLEERLVPLAEVERGALSRVFPLTGLLFRESDFAGPLPFHNPPRRQFVIPIIGAFEIVLEDGTTRLIGPGTVLLTEDVLGRGHASREVDVPRQTVFLPVPDDFTVMDWPRVT